MNDSFRQKHLNENIFLYDRVLEELQELVQHSLFVTQESREEGLCRQELCDAGSGASQNGIQLSDTSAEQVL